MIGFIKGELEGLIQDMAVIECSGIGYQIRVTNQTASVLPPFGKEVKLFTYLSVREDALDLYGFLTRDDLELFKLLIGVSGIGPKGALGILSGMTADELRLAILSGDAKAISKAPGVGAKTAQRLILDLKDKVSLQDSFSENGQALKSSQSGLEMAAGDAASEAAEALVALGYSPSEAYKAVKQVPLTKDMGADAVLKSALKKIRF